MKYLGAMPTRILYAPWREKVGGSGRITLMVPTDQGIFPLNILCSICHIPRNTLYNRLTVGEGGWQREGVLFNQRYKRPSEEPRVIDPADVMCLQDNEDDGGFGSVKGRRDPMTVRTGTWETVPREMTDLEWELRDRQKRLAQKRRDDEYRDCLRHHRAMCR